MLLTVDIGNTGIKFAIFKEKSIIKRFDILTRYYSLQKLRKHMEGYKIVDAIICSVVPRTGKQIARELELLLQKKIYQVNKNIPIPLIKNKYRKRNQVGQDRLVNAYAAAILYRYPAIIVDFGTAVTFDIISKKAEYLGGMIIPGLRIAFESLSKNTALLPSVKADKPKEFIGRNTRNSILSGLIYGYSFLACGMIEEIKKRVGKKLKVIGTGGNIDLIVNYCKKFDTIDKDLTVKGLNLIYLTRQNG